MPLGWKEHHSKGASLILSLKYNVLNVSWKGRWLNHHLPVRTPPRVKEFCAKLQHCVSIICSIYLYKQGKLYARAKEQCAHGTKTLVENLKKCKIVLPNRTGEEELYQICIWASNDWTMSSLPEINKRTEHIKLRVRDRWTFFCLSIPYIYLACFSVCRSHNLSSSCCIRLNLQLFKIKNYWKT